MTDDPTMPLPTPPSQDPGETLRPEMPVTPSNGTVSLSGGVASGPATDPTLIGDGAKSQAAQNGHTQFRKLGPYALVRLLGRGGMGAVWEALDTRLNRRVAVKVMVSGEHASEQETERFRREAQNSAKLRHPNIVPVHDFGIEAGQQYLVMDLVDGVMLADALRQRQFTYREKAILLEKVARAVHYAHEQGVIHRDLKPSNIMLEEKAGGSSSARGPERDTGSQQQTEAARGTPNPQFAIPNPQSSIRNPQSAEPLVMDFGLAKDIAKDSSLSQSGQVMGTPAYMPAEQAEGRIKDVGPRSDVYSLGAILYEMLTGRVPFTGGNAMQVLRAACHDDPVPPRRITPDVPCDLETICLKCLEKEPAKRYGSAQALAEDLGRWLRNEPIAARPASSTERLAKWVRRRPAAAALVVVSTLAVVLLIAWLSWVVVQERERARTEQERARTEAALRAGAEDRRREAETAQRAAIQERRVAEERLREIERRKAEGLLDASQVFKALLPGKVPQVPGFDIFVALNSAKDLTGNLYSFIAVDAKHLGILLAEVSQQNPKGPTTMKGAPAAIIAAITYPAWQVGAEKNLSPADVLSRTNHALFYRSILPQKTLVSATYAVVDVTTREMTISSAGYSPVLTWRAALKTDEKIKPAEVFLNTDERKFDKAVRDQKVVLERGDRVLICTNGIVALLSEQGQQWGEANLVRFLRENAHLSSKEFTRLLYQELYKHMGKAEQSEDLTVVTFRVE